MPTAIKNVTLHDVALHNARIRPAFFCKLLFQSQMRSVARWLQNYTMERAISQSTQPDTSHLTTACFTLLKQI
jgi:hypothetical protein